MKLYLYIIILSIIDVAAIFSAKQWQVSEKIYWLLVSFVLFGSMSVFFGMSLRQTASGVANAMWAAISAITIMILGYFFFKENITLWQIVGIFTIICGLILIEIK
jgi:multidrug transporter EmrE-like cation transporter